MASEVYGQILTEGDVRHAVEDTLKMWLPAYLGEVADQHSLDRGQLPDIRSWVNAPVFEEWPETQLPAVIVVTPGTNSAPEMLNRMVTVDWSIGIAVIVSAKDQETTGDLIGMYAAAARTIMVQKGSLGGFAVESHFLAERFDEHPIPEQFRTLRTAVVSCGVTVAGMNSRYGGPVVPPVDPTADPDDWPTIATVEEHLEKM